jgi:peptide/nickel transport system permease protein
MTDATVAIGAKQDALAEPDGGESPPGAPVEREFTVESRGQFELVWRRFIRHKAAMISFAVLVLFTLAVFVGAALWKYDLSIGTKVNNGRPTLDMIPWLDGDGLTIGDHPLGQDDIGRDYMAVVMNGAQRSLIIAVTAGLIATFLGTLVGAIAGFFRGGVDNVLMRFVDVALTIPLLLVAAVLGRRADDIPGLNSLFSENSVLLFGRSPDDVFYGEYFQEGSIILVALVIAFASWLTTARIIRAEFLSLREKEYVEAARALGASNSRIIRRHILPNVIGPLVVTATLLISSAILIESALSFLGFGVRTGSSLGLLVANNRTAFTTRPWLFWWPGLCILVIALTINFIGDGLRDAFDPRQTRVRQ